MRTTNSFITIICLVFLSLSLVAQTDSTEFQLHEAENYKISFPDDWVLDTSGLMGTKFFLFSSVADSTDTFRENVNMIIQDLAGYDLDLDKFVVLSEAQIEQLITDSKVIKSVRVKGEERDYQWTSYTGTQGVFKLLFEQYYWVFDDKAYILTYTAEVKNAELYKDVSKMILDSFSFK